ncbi:MAG: glycosyl transferase [Bacteroidales bacterium]|nr:glycosyl transferase [Bacteroidales bacterium]
MKILYAIQGTGNGHLSRARDIIPLLQKNHSVDILISGSQSDIELPFPVRYRLKGLGFVFGKNGGVDILETYRKNHVKSFFSEINSLPVFDYDLILNDFEPVSAWACKLFDVKCISLSHQSAVLNKNVPQPKKIDLLGKTILKNYAPSTSQYGFHFKAYDNNIFTPVIRKELRDQKIENSGHYTVYLPAYDNKRIVKVLQQCEDTHWQVFSKHNKTAITEGNIIIQPINNDTFIKSMATSEGVLCGAGFETPAEALFMNKKLMVIPMKGQFEQQCNAIALKEIGVPVLKSLKEKHVDKLKSWIAIGTTIEVNYPDNTEEIIETLLTRHTVDLHNESLQLDKSEYSLEKFRTLLLKKYRQFNTL